MVANAEDAVAAGIEGALPRAVALPAALVEAGWTTEQVRSWRPLVAPGRTLALDGGRIVMLLGTADSVTGYAGARMLADEWRVPAENLFVRRRGHFSVGLGLYRDGSPLLRLVEILKSQP